ncbi:MAG TPA: hypothetical protein VH105_23985 [Burkholderiales bacterium]|nr:hypothetical protein [Burkholderiales bacterium]
MPAPQSPDAGGPSEVQAGRIALRTWIAQDGFPAYSLDQLCAHPQRRLAAELLAAGNRLHAAEAALRQLLAENPQSAVDRMLLAEVLGKQGDLGQAHQLMNLVQDDPGRCGARAAAMLAEQAFFGGDFPVARALIERAAAVAPEAMNCQILLGCVRELAGVDTPPQYAQALEHFRRAVALRPADPLARVYVATALMRQGALQEGLAQWVIAECLGGTYANRAICPVWDGRPLGGARLLILTHSGYGDVIQFLRFAHHLRAREPRARLNLLIRAPLARLAQATGLFESVYTGAPEGEGFDWQVSQTHLPLLLGVEAPQLRSFEPYLQADAARLEAAQRWLPPRAAGRLRIGLRWAGHPGPFDAKRSVPLAALQPLFEVEGVDWVSLAEEPDATALQLGIADASAHLSDFYATAALMRQLDLVIAVDTSVAHLAGALALPTWLIARPDPDWRWGLEGEATPWYGSVRVFRHPPGTGVNWAAIARDLAAALRELVAKGGAR